MMMTAGLYFIIFVKCLEKLTLSDTLILVIYDTVIYRTQKTIRNSDTHQINNTLAINKVLTRQVPKRSRFSCAGI